ncbi:MAG: 50S ribosomal protein L17 [Deltaproteobacteria bacterium]|nr:50S ribosomal protein L17 [Deltaproteobacteria bacterium]
MRHANDHRKLGRSPGHRKALLRNLMNSLVLSERIETTVPKAKELKRLGDRLITLGKSGTLHARRRAFAMLSNKDATDKLFETLAGRFTAREGGYTRILRIGYRVGDGAEMAIIEYLPTEEKKAAAKGKKKAAAKKDSGKKETRAASTRSKVAGKSDRKGSVRGGQGVKPARAPRKSPSES